MPHLYPVVIPGGAQLVGQSLGFHAITLRIDNLSNQWLQEESSLAWIPPYSLGTCLRLYGTAVAIILNRAPVNQVQPPVVPGEYAAGFYTDEYRTEVAGVPVRQFTLIQAVSDLTEGPQPALPGTGVCRIWADSSGNLFHLHSDGTDPEIWDTRLPLGGVLVGTVPNPAFAVPMIVPGTIKSTAQTVPAAATGPGPEVFWDGTQSQFVGYNRLTSAYTDVFLQGHNVTLNPQGGVVIPNLSAQAIAGNRINGVTAGANTLCIGLAIPAGLLWIHAVIMAQNTSNVTVLDNYVWTITGQGGVGTITTQYMTVNYPVWNTCPLGPVIFDNRGATYTSIELRLTGSSTPCNIAADFGHLGYIRIG